jgi:lysophospholipase L1-like esterase
MRAALALAGVCVALALGEALVRVAGIAPQVGQVEAWRWRLAANPKIGYEPIPYAGPERSVPDPGHEGRANALGFRDHDHAVARAAGVRRVIVLGDSIAWGYRVVDDEAVFPLVLERLLASAGVAAEVLNFGVPGYKTQQEVETLADKGLVYDPDLVILAYCLNDEANADGGVYRQVLRREHDSAHLSAARLGTLLRHSELARAVRYMWFGEPPAPPGAEASIFENHTDEYFGLLAELSRRHGFEVLVVVFPNLGGFRAGAAYAYDEAHERVRGLSAREGFHHLDLLETFANCRDNAPGERFAFDSYHPTALGHRCAAEAIDRYVRQRLWTRTRRSGATSADTIREASHARPRRYDEADHGGDDEGRSFPGIVDGGTVHAVRAAGQRGKPRGGGT